MVTLIVDKYSDDVNYIVVSKTTTTAEIQELVYTANSNWYDDEEGGTWREYFEEVMPDDCELLSPSSFGCVYF